MRRHCRSGSNARPLPLLLLLLLLPLLHFCGLRPHMARAAPQLTATQLQKLRNDDSRENDPEPVPRRLLLEADEAECAKLPPRYGLHMRVLVAWDVRRAAGLRVLARKASDWIQMRRRRSRQGFVDPHFRIPSRHTTHNQHLPPVQNWNERPSVETADASALSASAKGA